MRERRQKIDSTMLDLKDTVVSINRVTKVVKGGKNLSFNALVVVGNQSGRASPQTSNQNTIQILDFFLKEKILLPLSAICMFFG